MKSIKFLYTGILLGSTLFVCQQSILATQREDSGSVDCSRPSEKECARVKLPDNTTVIHYGLPKEKKPVTELEWN